MGVNEGLVFISDLRTNAGVDNISTLSKLRRYGVPVERQFFICSAGNLATPQGVISRVDRDIRREAETNLMNVGNLNEAAHYLGALNREEQERTGGGAVFEASFLIGGEVLGAQCKVMLVYPEGNHIVSSRQTPFLQIGELKYGKPILDRVLKPTTSLDRAAVCGLVSMDATTRSNLTVGPPFEVVAYQAGSLQPGRHRVYEEDNLFLRMLKERWDEAVCYAFGSLPDIDWTAQEDA